MTTRLLYCRKICLIIAPGSPTPFYFTTLVVRQGGEFPIYFNFPLVHTSCLQITQNAANTGTVAFQFATLFRKTNRQ